MMIKLEATEENRPQRSNRENPCEGRTTATAETETSVTSRPWNASMMENSAEANDEQLGETTLSTKATSLDGSDIDGADTMGFSDCDHGEEEEHVVINDDDNNNAGRVEGGAGPEMSDGNSIPSRSVGTPGVKKAGGKAQKSKTRRFVGVRQRPSGRWVAEIKDSTQNIRLWLGTYDNAEDAAAAYDEAARALRGSNTRTNFGLPKAGTPEHPSKAIRLLLQRAKAASAAKTNPFNLKDVNSADYRTAKYDIYHQAHQQGYPKPEDGVVVDPDSPLPRNNTMGYTVEADRASSLSNPLSLNAMNSFTGRGAVQQQRNQGASGPCGRPPAGTTVELGTLDTEEKFTKAFIEMYTQLPSKRNATAEIYDGGDNRCQSVSSAGRTGSYGAANYNTSTRGEFMDLATGLGASGDQMNVLRMDRRPASVHNVNTGQQHNPDRMRQHTLLSAELDAGAGTGFGALPTVYSNLTKKLKDYLQSSYSGPSSILWQQLASSANLLPMSSSGQNPSVCPSFNASSFRQQEEARVNVFGQPTSRTWMESESTSSSLSQSEIPGSSPGLFRSISDSLRSPGVPFPSADFLPQEALWSQTQELSTVPVC